MKYGFVYILRSRKSSKFYIGSTTNIKQRLHQHGMGIVKATRSLRPLDVKLYQEYPSFSLARKIENKLKKLKRKDFIEKIVKDGVIKLGL